MTLEGWIAGVHGTEWNRSALIPTVERLRPVLVTRFGDDVQFEWVDRATTVDTENEDATSAFLTVCGERWARVSLASSVDAAVASDLTDTVALAGRILGDVETCWTSKVLDTVSALLSESGEAPIVLNDALDQLRNALEADVVALLEFRGGAFVPYAVEGDADAIALARSMAGGLDEGSASSVAYADGHAHYLDAVPDEEAHPSGRPPVGPRLASIAVHPLPQRAYSHLQLAAGRLEPRPWRNADRTLIDGAGRTFRLYLERQRRSELLGRILELERALLARVDSEPMQLIIDTLVDLVPGAEAGSILIRDGDLFRYRGITEYDAAGLANVALDEPALRTWYDDGRDKRQAARLLRTPEGIAAASRQAAGDPVGTVTDLDRIVANLALPIEHDGRWSAFVNLDAFASEHAFLENDRRLLESFAPIIGLVLLEIDVRRELRRFASFDELTGLLNRRAFDITLRQEMRRNQRSNTPLALLVMDLDNFKRLNDEFGHAAGDEGLRAVAMAIQSTARESDHVFRWGGDEFAALLPDTDRAGADRMVARLTEAVGAVVAEGLTLKMSIGVAVQHPDDDADSDAMLSQADEEMYAAKRRTSG